MHFPSSLFCTQNGRSCEKAQVSAIFSPKKMLGFRSALKDALNTTRAMSVDEAYANAVINEALSTDDEADETSEVPTKADLNAAEDEDKKDL